MGLAHIGVRPDNPKRAALEKRFELLREKRIRAARNDLWEYCRLESPEFYTVENWHLRVLCFTLQALYEKRLTRGALLGFCMQYSPAWFMESFDWDSMQHDRVYKKLMINMPPRTGKSRTLVNFCKWCFGKNPANKIITGSYNDEMAQDFSRYTRDGIQETKTYPQELIYSDVFKTTKIKRGDASYGKWALEGQFFSYKGAGVGGSVTGKGCNISIVDDPVKDAAEAFNENRLDAIYTWYSGTFRSRLEKDGIQIINMTRWAESDICGRLLSSKERTGVRRHEWVALVMTACDDVREGGTGNMLCPNLLDREMYDDLKDTIDESIFNANYRQTPVDERGRMYKHFLTYTEIPTEGGHYMFDEIISYTDTADTGEDYLCSIVAGRYQGRLYVLDVLYTKDSMEETEIETAAMFVRNFVNVARIESNNGGRGFARNVKRIMAERYKNNSTQIRPFHQSKNKRSRIFSNRSNVTNTVLFPINWKDLWPEYYRAMVEYKREGNNKHDDAPDATTGLIEEDVKREGRMAQAVSLRR